MIYLSGKDYVEDFLLFSICANSKIEISTIYELINYVNNCEVPKFPISGEYLKRHGYESGKVLGQRLKLLEENWIKNNFVLDKKIIKKTLDKDK